MFYLLVGDGGMSEDGNESIFIEFDATRSGGEHLHWLHLVPIHSLALHRELGLAEADDKR